MKFKHISQSGRFNSGKPRLYYRRAGKKAIPLPDVDISSPDFEVAYHRAKEMWESDLSGPVEHPQIRKIIDKGVARAASRAKAKNLPFDITSDDILNLCRKQGWACAVSRIKFSLSEGDGRRKPFAPSIDRVDNTMGYTLDNIRIVTTLTNIAISDFGMEAFIKMCKSVSRHNTSNFRDGFQLDDLCD